jgi:cyanate lyase
MYELTDLIERLRLAKKAGITYDRISRESGINKARFYNASSSRTALSEEEIKAVMEAIKEIAVNEQISLKTRYEEIGSSIKRLQEL